MKDAPALDDFALFLAVADAGGLAGRPRPAASPRPRCRAGSPHWSGGSARRSFDAAHRAMR
ncbi:MAG: hypothetical protein R3D80_18295 [Paracoccaceae bacterium]